jgi:hypothetical protein
MDIFYYFNFSLKICLYSDKNKNNRVLSLNKNIFLSDEKTRILISVIKFININQ